MLPTSPVGTQRRKSLAEFERKVHRTKARVRARQPGLQRPPKPGLKLEEHGFGTGRRDRSLLSCDLEALKCTDTVWGAPTGRTGVGAKLLGSGGAKVFTTAGPVVADADVVELLLKFLFVQRPERLTGVIAAGVAGQTEDAGN